VSNPAKINDALWSRIADLDFSKLVIFLPSRRAIRSVEEMIVGRCGRAVLLPRLVALGDAPDSALDEDMSANSQRVLILAKMIAEFAQIRYGHALPLASDLVRMADNLEMNGRGGEIDWAGLVDEKYSAHWQAKAKFLDFATTVLPQIFGDKITHAKKRDDDIRAWRDNLDGMHAIVCGSTASVPATADLMEFIARMHGGEIILPGNISAMRGDMEIQTNPYHNEYKFLQRVGIRPDEVSVIAVGPSRADALNECFDNMHRPSRITPGDCAAARIDCDTEADEAETIADIAAENPNSAVLIITPDAAGEYRLESALANRGIAFDTSVGTSGAMTRIGRFILTAFDGISGDIPDLFACVQQALAGWNEFDDNDFAVLDALRAASAVLGENGIVLDGDSAAAVAKMILSGVSTRRPAPDAARVRVLGLIESRMQTADIVILSGLNEGVFPANGYENAWLPRNISDAVGLPGPKAKVSLQALDFINLSCAPVVYWTRAKKSGGGETIESRFLTRASLNPALSVMSAPRRAPEIKYAPLPNAMDNPPASAAHNAPIFVTRLEDLIHNPYLYYAKKILNLRRLPDAWENTNALEFGNLVHDAVEKYLSGNSGDLRAALESAASATLSGNNLLLYFWRRRFDEIVPVAQKLKSNINGAVLTETVGEMKIAGRVVRAQADLVSGDTVYDIKTGALPTNSQLAAGTMPQLPLEKIIFGRDKMSFIALQRGAAGIRDFTPEQTMKFADAAVAKATEVFNIFSQSGARYEYRPTTIWKYREYDDLARID
jgi:inactivated superfamily I helicase